MNHLTEPTLKFRYDYDYLICFKPKERCGTWLGRMFGHVILFRNITATTSIRIETTLGGTLIVPYKCNVREILPELICDFSTHVWNVKHEDMAGVNIMMVNSCVGIIKNMLGIKAWWIILPKQLENYIKKGR